MDNVVNAFQEVLSRTNPNISLIVEGDLIRFAHDGRVLITQVMISALGQISELHGPSSVLSAIDLIMAEVNQEISMCANLEK